MELEDLSEAKLAWMIWQKLEELNDLLWNRYEDHFLTFALDQNQNNETEIDRRQNNLANPESSQNNL